MIRLSFPRRDKLGICFSLHGAPKDCQLDSSVSEASTSSARSASSDLITSRMPAPSTRCGRRPPQSSRLIVQSIPNASRAIFAISASDSLRKVRIVTRSGFVASGPEVVSRASSNDYSVAGYRTPTPTQLLAGALIPNRLSQGRAEKAAPPLQNRKTAAEEVTSLRGSPSRWADRRVSCHRTLTTPKSALLTKRRKRSSTSSGQILYVSRTASSNDAVQNLKCWSFCSRRSILGRICSAV